jgi:subtilisin family serine protease
VLAYPDNPAHADDLRSQIESESADRPAPPLGIDPKAILVVSLRRPVSGEIWASVDVQELDGRSLEQTVAFSNRVDLAAFLERLSRYQAATPSEKGNLFGADLFDQINSVRFYGPGDRVTRRLKQVLDEAADDDLLNVDIEVWHPGDTTAADVADEWFGIVRNAVTALGGHQMDWYVNHDAGVMLMRARVSAKSVGALSRLDEVSSMDLKPSPPNSLTNIDELTVADLPEISGPSGDSPLFAIIDSGVSGAHPLIGPALYEAVTLLPDLEDGADQHGHGTAVAGVALHGVTEDWLQIGVLAPFARLLSIRVLDSANAFPDEKLWVKAVVEAVEHAAERGCRVVNLSIGDRDGAITDRRATRLAALLDNLARERSLVIVVPTGNIEDLTVYIAPSADAHREYVRASLTTEETSLIDPAPAALALTVGGLGSDGPLPLGENPMGTSTNVSAVSRRGPGIARGLKPELTAPAGTKAWNDTTGYVDRRQLQPVLLSHLPDELFTRSHGTSFAAPAITRVATAVQAAYPNAGAPLIRALVLQGATIPAFDPDLLPDGTKGARTRARLATIGHGQPTVDRARFSQRDRVVLVAEGELEVDKVVIYEVPFPDIFFESGGTRTIDVAVAFDPLTRYRRKDYLGSRLYPYLFLGHTTEEVLGVLAEIDQDELEADDYEVTDADPDTDVDEDTEKAKSGLASLRRIEFTPSTGASSDSANILLCCRRHQKFDPSIDRVAHLAIRSSSQWAPDGTKDPFGVAVALGYSSADVDVYEEIRSRIEVEVPIEAEVEVEVEQ